MDHWLYMVAPAWMPTSRLGSECSQLWLSLEFASLIPFVFVISSSCGGTWSGGGKTGSKEMNNSMLLQLSSAADQAQV